MPGIKQLFTRLTGYWIHKKATLPIGSDLFFDIRYRIGIKNIDLTFDVGANIGQTVNWIKHHQPKSKIVAFEPVKKTFDLLKENSKKFNRVVFENKALGANEEEVEISLFDELSVLNSLRPELMNNSVSAVKQKIHVETLDAYCSKNNISHIGLLKIDTEGFEIPVLEGAEIMLQEGRIDLIFSEVGFYKANNRNTFFPDLSAYLEKKGFRFFALYQIDNTLCRSGMNYGNALYVSTKVFR